MKKFQTQIKHVFAEILAQLAPYINWKMIVDVDFGA